MIRPYYEDGSVTIYHGDCRDLMVPLCFQGASIITDPPYGETQLPWDRWPTGWVAVAAAAVGVRGSLWCFGSFRMFMDQRDEFSAWDYGQELVWEKPRGSGLNADRFRRVHELCVHWYHGKWTDLHRDVPRTRSFGPDKSGRRSTTAKRIHGEQASSAYVDDGTRLMRSIVAAPHPPGRGLHPTEKPQGVLRPLVTYSTPVGGLVVDLFAGSGSTLRAAKDAGRRAIGIEIDERYCEIAATRMSQEVLDVA